MTKFTYTAKNKDKKIIKGSIDASDRESVLNTLKNQEMSPLVVEKQFSLGDFSIGSRSLSIKDRYLFTQQFAVMVKAGLPLIEALTILEEEAENKNMKKLLKNIVSDIKGGSNLGTAFEKSKAFPSYYIAVLRSGEKSGKLDQILLRLSQHMEDDYNLRAKLKSALMMPAVVLVVMAIVIAVILIFVIPQLMSLFTESNVKLPLTTRILLSSSQILSQFWYVFLILIAIIIVAYKYIKKTSIEKLFFDKLKLKTPILGKLTKSVIISRLCSTMATLLSSGMPVLETMETCADVVDNGIYRKLLLKSKDELEQGKSLSSAITEKKYIPALVNQMIKIGEKSGNTEYVLNELAKFYENEANTTTKNLMTLLEPVITVFLGIGVAFVVLSVLTPIYSLINATE